MMGEGDYGGDMGGEQADIRDLKAEPSMLMAHLPVRLDVPSTYLAIYRQRNFAILANWRTESLWSDTVVYWSARAIFSGTDNRRCAAAIRKAATATQFGFWTDRETGVQGGKSAHLNVHTGKSCRLQVKIAIPLKEHPNFNFVGKLLGPKGSSLKQLQELTQTRMAILGRGSMRDKKKEEELRSKGEQKYAHLNDELHVEVSAFAPPSEAYRRVAHAIDELARFLRPDQGEEMHQYPMQEMGMNGRGGPKPPPPNYGYEGPAAARPPPPGPPARGSGYWASAPPSRGGGTPRRVLQPRPSPSAPRRPAPPPPANEYSYDDGSYGRYEAPGARNDYYNEAPIDEGADFAADDYGGGAGGGPARNFPRARPYNASTRPY